MGEGTPMLYFLNILLIRTDSCSTENIAEALISQLYTCCGSFGLCLDYMLLEIKSPLVDHSSTDDSTDEPVATEKGRKKTKSKEEKKSRPDRAKSGPVGGGQLQQVTDNIKARYRRKGLVKSSAEQDPWPPFHAKSFTNLALVHQKILQLQTKQDAIIAARIRTMGDVHKIRELTSSIKLDNIHQIFTPITSDDQCLNSILIEGHPGIGKTTLAKEICLQWANNKLLTSDKLLLLLMLRDPNVQKITSTEELVKYTLPEDQVQPVLSYLHTTNGDGVTFIIDGFDELSNELRHTSFFRKLIEGDTLPNAQVVVTSRPSASACLHQHVDRRIEVLGFEKSSREQYIDDALKTSPSKLQTLKRHFQQYPNIDAICYIPLNMTIIVFLCLLGSLPPTATEMFASFILHTVCRHLKRTGKIAEDAHINKMEHLPQPVQQVLQQLQKGAFDGLVEDKIVFTMDDLPDMCRDDPTCYGLLQSVECYCSDEIGTPTKSFNFLHLGIQEYFAAKYVAILPEHEVYILMKESFLVTDGSYKPDPDSKSVRLSNMWIMYCGITSGQCNSLRHYLSSFNDYTDNYFSDDDYLESSLLYNDSNYDFLHDNDYEDNDQYYSIEENTTQSSGDDNSTTSDHQITPTHHPSSTITPVMSHWCDSLQISSISSPSLPPPTQPVRYPLTSSRGEHFTTYPQPLMEHHNVYHPYQQQQLGYHPVSSHHDPSNSEHVTTNINTQVASGKMAAPSQQGSTSDQEISNILTISQDILKDPVKVLYLFQCFQEAQDDKLCDILSESFDSDKIDLHYYRLLPHQVVSLGFFLSRSHRKWKELNLLRCYIGDYDINLLHHYLCGDKTNKQEITTIDLSDNDLTIASSPLIGDIITHLQPHTLMLSDNNITSVRDISTTIINTNTVKVLHMMINYLTAQDASAISDMMTCLEVLYISHNRLGDDGAVIISKGITKTNTLRALYIRNNNITAKGATAIANSLLHNTSLEELDMTDNAIGQDGVTAIAQAITNNKTLKELYLYDDDTIDEQSAMIIMRSLHHNNSITKLQLPHTLKYNVKREVEHINSTRRKCNIQELVVFYV
ncbi:protein NLRC3-like isoform X3 [Dysidea avara]|uniref:protein NLRC3-like isoform X3 n=1 Tax=Dysidea avara TaxID=196820 RepID=UPI0033335A73